MQWSSALFVAQEALLDALYPRLCLITGNPLLPNEREVSQSLLVQLPQTHFHLHAANNALLHQMVHVPAVMAAAACFHFVPTGPIQTLIHELKYNGRPQVGRVLGQFYGNQVAGATWLAGMQALVPIPLSKARQRERGYNQSEQIAIGLGKALGVPVDAKALMRTRFSGSQTGLSRAERKQNVEGVFVAVNPPPNVVLVDDVSTTGATLAEAAQTLAAAGCQRIAVLALAAAGQDV